MNKDTNIKELFKPIKCSARNLHIHLCRCGYTYKGKEYPVSKKCVKKLNKIIKEIDDLKLLMEDLTK